MSIHKEKLNIIDGDDNIIGQESREKIHRMGLLHREVHVWFFNRKGEVFLQHRKKTAETFPDLLDVTVGGHVEIGDSYVSTAIKETREETGVVITEHDLIEFIKQKRESYDPATGLNNRVIGFIYGFRYSGSEDELRGEEGIGFERWAVDEILDLKDENIKKRFIPVIFSDYMTDVLKKIKNLNFN